MPTGRRRRCRARSNPSPPGSTTTPGRWRRPGSWVPPGHSVPLRCWAPGHWVPSWSSSTGSNDVGGPPMPERLRRSLPLPGLPSRVVRGSGMRRRTGAVSARTPRKAGASTATTRAGGRLGLWRPSWPVSTGPDRRPLPPPRRAPGEDAASPPGRAPLPPRPARSDARPRRQWPARVPAPAPSSAAPDRLTEHSFQGRQGSLGRRLQGAPRVDARSHSCTENVDDLRNALLHLLPPDSRRPNRSEELQLPLVQGDRSGGRSEPGAAARRSVTSRSGGSGSPDGRSEPEG